MVSYGFTTPALTRPRMFHAYPWAMEFDPHSGDYGLGFFGNALEAGAYYVQHPRLGALCYLCSASPATAFPAANSSEAGQGMEAGQGVSLTPEDAYHRRVFLEPLSLCV